MPDKDSQYKKVVFKEDRAPKGRSLAVIIEKFTNCEEQSHECEGFGDD